jgi:hypothetical protein
MRTISGILTLLIVFLCQVAAGEKPVIHLTGNESVDFFSGPRQILSEPRVPFQRDGSGGDVTKGEGEKSPWTAGLLSLAVPGAGEIYTSNYVKAGVFIAVEASAWIVAFTYNKKGDNQTDYFQAYADAHWSPIRYAEFTIDNLAVLNPTMPAADYHSLVFPNGTSANTTAPFRAVSWSELNKMEDLVRAQVNNGYTHLLPPYGDQQYYELIGKYPQFSRGWDDADPSSITPSDLPLRSNSQRFFDYAKMRAQANDYYDIAGTFISVAVVNHLVSALDAIWSAARFNSNLHADFKMRVAPTQFGVAPQAEAKFRYNF